MIALLFSTFVISLTVADVYRSRLQRQTIRSKRRLLDSNDNASHNGFNGGTPRSTGTMPIFTDQDQYYAIEVTLGTPAQRFLLRFETESSDLWVTSTYCQSDGCQSPGSGRKRIHFDDEASTTYQYTGAIYNINYGNLVVSGLLVYDILQFAQLSSTLQAFSLAYEVSDSFSNEPVDGVFGMGWPSLANCAQVIPPVQNVLPQLDNPLFTLRLSGQAIPVDDVDIAKEEEWYQYGQITMGDYDDQCDTGSTVYWTKTISSTYWDFSIGGFCMDNYAVDRAQTAYIATGTSYIGGPKAYIDKLVEQIGGKYNPDSLNYEADCNLQETAQPFVVYLGDYCRFVPPSIYFEKKDDNDRDDDDKCILKFYARQAGGFSPQWSFGTSFNIDHCTIFDIGNHELGFLWVKSAKDAERHNTMIYPQSV